MANCCSGLVNAANRLHCIQYYRTLYVIIIGNTDSPVIGYLYENKIILKCIYTIMKILQRHSKKDASCNLNKWFINYIIIVI